jgi:hypothetical protein
MYPKILNAGNQFAQGLIPIVKYIKTIDEVCGLQVYMNYRYADIRLLVYDENQVFPCNKNINPEYTRKSRG